MVERAQEIIAWAKAHLGVREEPRGSNDGTALRHMLASTAFKPGDKWCMFFAEAAVKAGYEGYGKIPHHISLTGSCADAARAALEVYKLSDYPATGCIAVFRGGIRGYHHAGIVYRIDEGKDRPPTPNNDGHDYFWSYEGNTNSNGSVEGYAVCSHRHERSRARFIIW